MVEEFEDEWTRTVGAMDDFVGGSLTMLGLDETTGVGVGVEEG